MKEYIKFKYKGNSYTMTNSCFRNFVEMRTSETEISEEGFYLVEKGTKPQLKDDEELAYTYTIENGIAKKTYSAVPKGTIFNIPRKFSKLSLYIACCSNKVSWDSIEEWMKNKETSDGINIFKAYEKAQELSEDHPLFSLYFNMIKTDLNISDETAEKILEESKIS